MAEVKDYNYETDIIKTPDPIYRIGQRVYLGDCKDTLKVQSVVWSTLRETWSYTLTNVDDFKRLEGAAEKNLRAVK